MNRLTRTALASSATLAALAAVAAPVSAAPVPVHYHIVNIEVIDGYLARLGCDVSDGRDVTIRREQYIDGMTMDRSLGPAGLKYFSDQYRFTTVRTNLANGKTLTSDGLSNVRDQRVINNGDGTLTVKSSVINSDRTYDVSGKTVSSFAVRFEFESLFADGGTPNDPSDDVLLAGDLTKFVGMDRDAEFCGLVRNVLF